MNKFKNLNYITFILATFTLATSGQEFGKQQIQSYASCRLDKDCNDNAFCYGNDDNKVGKCKCVTGFELIRNSTFYECLEGVKVGEECKKDIQCHITASQLSFCNQSNICQCSTEAHMGPNGICYMSVGLREICMTDNNCYLGNGKFGYCAIGRCACPLGQRPSVNNTHCITAKKIGEVCQVDEECVHPNTRCTDICRCKTEYVLGRNGTRCIKAATAFGENCSFDGQCSGFLSQSICNNETCTCANGYHEAGIKCVKSVRPGQYCEDDTQCIYESKLKGNVNCRNAICTCAFGTDSDGNCNIENFGTGSSDKIRYSLFTLILSFFMFIIITIT